MTDKDRAWIDELRETKTEGHIGFGCRQMRRLLAIVDSLDAEADKLARSLAQSSAPCPTDGFCVDKARPECPGLDDETKCQTCYREEARHVRR